MDAILLERADRLYHKQDLVNAVTAPATNPDQLYEQVCAALQSLESDKWDHPTHTSNTFQTLARIAAWSKKLKPAVNILFCHIKSAAAEPGKGVHECLTVPCDGLPLNFRRMLSNCSEAAWRNGRPVMYSSFVADDGLKYPTVEHALHAYKFRFMSGRRGQAAAWAFSVRQDRVEVGWSGIGLGKKKQLKLNVTQQREWSSIKSAVMQSLLYARFSQNAYLRAVLTAIPSDVQLWHGTRGVPPRRMVELETVREALREALHK